MSFPVNLQALPSRVLHEVLSPENVRGRKSPTSLSFPRSRSALWDSSPAGDNLLLHLCSHRKPQLVLLEKALRLAQRHVRHNKKPHLHGFFLGSVSVNSDEEGVTVNLDRFDPGRKQTSGVVPSALLPGDVLVPCLFTQSEGVSDSVVQSEAELHHCFKALQQFLGSRQILDLSQLLKVRGRVVCSQLSDGAAFGLSWSAVCPSVGLDVQPIQAIPIIPTALLRSLSINRPLQLTSNQQRGFLTMDQTRKLLLLLESDPKASTLPLVGLWLSGVTYIYNPQVWAWCLRFLFSNSLQDRVLSESNSFLLVVFVATHRTPQFFQCRVPRVGPAPQLGYQLLTAFQPVTLYQVESMDSRTLQCELGSDNDSQQMEVFMNAQSSFSSSTPPAAGLSVSDQDSGVEDEDLSPRPSPSPHAPAQQTRKVQPCVPELSLLIDSSFTSNQLVTTHIPRPPPFVDKKSAATTGNTFTTTTTFSAPTPAPPHHLHSTPNSNMQQPCTCCSTQAYDCTSIFSSPGFHPASAPSLHPQTPPVLPPKPSNDPALSAQGPSMFSHRTPDPLSNQHPSPSSFKHFSPPLFQKPSAPFSTCHHTPLASTLLPPPVVECGDSPPSPHASSPADPLSRLCLQRPLCENQCCNQVGGAVQSDTYQLLLQQDQQLRLLQAQVQMLLEAQRKLQSCSQRDTQTPRSTASIAVGTGASLFWGHSDQALPHDEAQIPPPSSTSPPLSSSPSHISSSHELSVAEAGYDPGPVAPCSPSRSHSISGLQTILGESVSMYRPADEQQSFYHNLMTQLTSRLQESDIKQEVEENKSKMSDPSQSSQMSSSSLKQVGDPVVSATLRQLQHLGVDVEERTLTESDRNRVRTVESTSTLACVNPAAVVSRLSVSDMTVSSLLPGGSVDLSLEANAIALRYLSDSQLCRLSLGGPTPQPALATSCNSLLSPNMSLATRKYMRKYGLIEEEDEEEQEVVKVQEVPSRQPFTETLNVKFLPQSQLIRDLRPKLQLLVEGVKMNTGKDEENRSGRQTEGSVGNILDLSRLRQLPKLF